MIILAVNSGSSSIRLSAFRGNADKPVLIAEQHSGITTESPRDILKRFLSGHQIDEVSIVSHRVVHGGTKLVQTCLIDDKVESEIRRLSPLAPLHNPPALKWIEACRSVLGPEIPRAAVFDTAFYSSMPERSKMYALPQDLCRKYEIRRYGFHGLAHRAMLQRWTNLRKDIAGGGKIISLQLGAGCSMTAVDNGKPIDTSMGFSPLEGLVMATRSGDIDPGLIPYLQKTAGLGISEVEEMLNHSSGLLGLSGISGDMKTLLAADGPEAKAAVDLYCYRAKKYIGACIAALNGIDGILFGGGVGENAPPVRERILGDMEWLGIELDKTANSKAIGKESLISPSRSKIDVRVIPVNEAEILAREALSIMEHL